MKVYCFKYLGSQMVADGGFESDMRHIMNEGYKAWPGGINQTCYVQSHVAKCD